MTLTPAQIEILDPELVGGDRGLTSPIEVQFNPTEYSLAKGAQIAEIAIPGLDSPILQFIRGQNEKLTLELFFDTSKNGMGPGGRNVDELTEPVYQLVKIQPETHAPPRIRFTWGESLSFKAIVESVQRKYSLFNPEGVPLRATLSVTFREYKTLTDQLAELNLQSADHSKRWVVKAGETLSGIAFAVYRDPGKWRLIARRNADVITNPRLLEPGTTLVVPPVEAYPAAEVLR